jgi:hypothetical protein
MLQQSSIFGQLVGFLFICLLTLASSRLSAQNITNYTFSASSSTFTTLSSPSNPTLVGNVDDGYFNSIPIGFDFWYMGARYTTVSASTNGWLTLGANITDAAYVNSLASGGAPRPILAPLWDDLDLQAATNLSYKTTGSAPNRVFTVQYLNVEWDYEASGNTMSFQVNLNEGSGKIEFVYRRETKPAKNPSGSIGIAATATGSGNFLSVVNNGTSASSTTESNITTKPISGNKYSFTPPIPATPTSLLFSDIDSTSMTLNWADASFNETGFVIYRSTDGITYTFVSQTAANTNSSTQTGLSPSTLYYWRVYAVSEGGLSSTVLSGNQATTCSQPSPPSVTSPVNYCQNASAVQLSATGTDLAWGGVTGTVGGTSTLTSLAYVDHTYNNKKTNFKTLAANVEITTVDYYIPAYQSVTGLVLSLFNSGGTVIATSSTSTTLSAGASTVRIRNTFNYTITTAGDYSIGLSAGTGNIGYDSPSFPISEASGTVNITGVSVSGVRCFNNIQFAITSSAIAPTPSTTTVGTFNYTVSQTVSGCISPQATIVVNVTAPVISQIPTSGLISNYTLTGNANDATGNNNGTLQNSPSAVADRFGNANRAYSFNGSSQYISTEVSYVSPTDFTISIWFKTATTTGGKLIGFGVSQTGLSYQYDRHLYMNNAGQIYFGVYPGIVKTINSPSSYNDNNWHLATATLSSSGGMVLYIDGVSVATDPSTTTAESATGYWRIGYDNVNGWPSQPGSTYFSGTLDDALIYSRAINSTEAATLFTSPDGAGNNGPACVGASITLNATTISGGSYAWTGPNGFTSSTQNPMFTYATTSAGLYTLEVTEAGCTVYAYTNVIPSANAGQWTGSVNTDWATAGNWCAGAIPTDTTHVVIPSSATNMPAITSSVACKNLTIQAGATLTTSIAGTLNIAGTLTNSGTMLNHGTTNFNGTSGQQTFSGVSSFYNLELNNATGLLLPASITVQNNLSILAGTLNANNFNVTVSGNWVNNSSITAFTAGTGTVTFNGTAAQSIAGSFLTAFNNLTISNIGNTVSLGVNASITGNLTVTSGTFDLVNFTANRATSGGSLLISNGACMKIGGTNSYPSNYATNSLAIMSIVEYSGTNQTVANQLYGNLTLSSSSGAAVKTLPGSALTIEGNLTSVIGSGSSVSYTAASNITVNGNINIDTATTFDGGSYAHIFDGNWVNNGTFTGSTSTVTLIGAGSSLSGTGAQNFHNLTISASSIILSSSSIAVSGNLATISSGTFSHPSSGTLTMTGTSKTISGAGIDLGNLTVSGTVTTANSINLSGNLSISGSLTASAGTITMKGSSKTISGAGTKSFAVLSIPGAITTDASFSIATSLIVVGSISASAGTATFTGTSTLSGTANLYNVDINGTTLHLASNATLGIANALSITAGTLHVSSATPNTVNFNGTGAQNVNNITYDNLILSNGNTKTAIGGITVNNSLTIASGTTFDPGAYTHNIYVNWNNYGSFTAGLSTIQFLGDQNTNITGPTTFNILTVNNTHAVTGIILKDNISAATVNMTQGSMHTKSYTLTITNTRTGNGIILGNIQRTHAFTTGVAYAFEGPDNTITFSAVSSVTSITVSVEKTSISGFPYGASINRLYDISVPAGTYTATLRLHYEEDELNGNTESSLLLWNYQGALWLPVGKTGNDTSANYVEQSGLTDIATSWTCAYAPDVVQWNGSVSSDWSTAANWTVLLGSGSTPPAATDVVALGTAAFTNQPSISTSVTVKNLVFGSAQNVTLSMASGGSFTSGDVLGIWSGNATHTIDVDNQTMTINGNLQLSDDTTGHTIDLNIGTGTVNITGSLIENGGADITFSGAGKLNISKDFMYASGTFTAGTGTVEYSGSENQEVAQVNYYHLTINKISGIASIQEDVEIGGNLLVESGELNNFSDTDIEGNVTIESGAIFHNNDQLNVGGNWTNNGTYNGASAAITFDGSGTQTISASTFNNLTINKPVGSIAELTDHIVLKGDLTVISGTFDIKTFDCNRDELGGTLTFADSATFMVGANNAPLNFSNGNLAVSSTVIANGNSAQFIYGVDFGNLVFSNSGAKTLITPITVKGNLVIESGASFDAGANTLTLGGNWVNNGTFIASSSTIMCTGTSKTIEGNSTFNRFFVHGTYTVEDDITFDSLLVINSTGSISGGSSILTTMNGDLTNRGILFTLGATTFTGTRLQTLRLIDAVQTVAVTVNFNGSVSPVLNSTAAPQFGYLNINNTGGVNPSVGWTILNDLSVGSGASFNGGESTHNLFGSLANAGAITSSGTLNFTPSSAKTIDLGSDFTSTGSVVLGGSGAITMSGSAGNFHHIDLTNTHVAGVSPSSDWDISGSLSISSGSLLNAGNHTYALGQDLINNGTISSGASTFLLNGTDHQDIYTGSAFYNLTIDKASNHVTLFSDATVNGDLNFVSGIIETGANVLIQPAIGTVTGAAQNTGWVYGRMQKNTGTGAATKSFEVGDATNFTPVALAFANVTTAGDLIAFTSTGEHPEINSSAINPSKSVNRSWTISNEGVVFTQYAATLNFVASDIDAGATTAAFGVVIHDGSSWEPLVAASPNATNIQATGITKFGVYAIGEVCNAATTIAYSGSPYCTGSGSATVTLNGTSGGSFTTDPQVSINASSGAIDLDASLAGNYSVSYHIDAVGGCPAYLTTTAISISAEASATISYEGSPFCSSANPGAVTRIGTTNGFFSAANGLSIDTISGVIYPQTSTAGTYTVTYAIPAIGGCTAFSTNTSVTITTQPFGYGTYEGNPYCSNGDIAYPTGYAEGLPGLLSSTTGLVIDGPTGEIDLAASTPGLYTVTYTVPDSAGCAEYTNTATVDITAAPSAMVEYTANPYCPNAGTATVTLTGTNGGDFSSTAGLMMDTTSGEITLASSLPGSYTVTYAVTADGCAEFTTTASFAITAGIWTGSVSTDWNDSDNWICDFIPISTTNVIIPDSITNYPVIDSGTGIMHNLSIETDAILTVSDATLQIGGSINNSGTFDAVEGTIEFNGTAAQTIAASTFEGDLLQDLTINNAAGVTLGGALNLFGALTIADGSLAAGGYLTLESTATGTASVAQITSAAGTPISGNVIVERYIPGRRKYRLITSSVTTSTETTLGSGDESLSIWGNWQNEGDNATANVGTLITGGSANDGFDTQTGNASLFTYDDVNKKYVGFTSANGKNTKYTPLKAGIAYFMFVYGDRQNSVFTTNPNNTVLRETGILKTGDQVYDLNSEIPLTGVTGRFTMLGNPFASAIDWANIPKTDLENTYWGWDPNLSSTGGYVTVSTFGNVTIQAPFSGSTGLNQYIQAGQGFFVKTSGSAPELTIREQDKVSNFNANAFRPNESLSDLSLLAVNLQYKKDTSTVLADGVLVVFAPVSPSEPGAVNASKLEGNAENIAIVNDTTLLSIHSRQLLVIDDTLFLKVSRLTKPTYTLQIFAQQMVDSEIDAYLLDHFLNTTQLLSWSDTNNIEIQVDPAIEGSAATNRFSIVFHPQNTVPTITLPGAAQSVVKVFPNPVMDHQITLEITHAMAGNYNFQLMNTQGQVQVNETRGHPGGTLHHILNLNHELAAGVYYLHVKSNSGNYIQVIVIQ